MPDYPEIPYCKAIRIIECVFCLGLVILFLIFAVHKNPEVFGNNLTAMCYIAYGGFLLILIIDIVSQIAGEPIAPVPMSLFCLTGFALHLTAGIMMTYDWTEYKDGEMTNPMFCLLVGIISIVSAIVFLIDVIIYLRNMLSKRSRVHPTKRPVIVSPFRPERLEASDDQDQYQDATTRDTKPIHVLTEVKIIHVESRPRCYCNKTVQTGECGAHDEIPITRRIEWRDDQVPSSSQATAEVKTDVVQSGPNLNVTSIRDVGVQNEDVDRYPAKTRLASSKTIVEIHDKDIQTECPCVEPSKPKRQPVEIDEGFQTYMNVRDVWAQNGIVSTSPVQSRRITALPGEVDVTHRLTQTEESDRSLQFNENNAMMDVSVQNGDAVQFPSLVKPHVKQSDSTTYDHSTQTEFEVEEPAVMSATSEDDIVDSDHTYEIEPDKPSPTITPTINVGEKMDVSVQNGVAVQFPTHVKPRAVDLDTAMYDIGTQTESTASLPDYVQEAEEADERVATPPTGCCGSKKKKKPRNTRRSEYLKRSSLADQDSIGHYDTDMPEDQVWPPEKFPQSRRRSDYVGREDLGTQIGSVSSIDTPAKFTRRSDYTGLNRTEETQTSLLEIDEISEPEKEIIDSRSSSAQPATKPVETQTSRSVLAESQVTSISRGTGTQLEEPKQDSSEEGDSPVSTYPTVEDEDVWPGARSQSGPLRHSQTEVVPSAPSQKECNCPPLTDPRDSATGPKPTYVTEVPAKKSSTRPTSKSPKAKQTKEPSRTKSRASGPRSSPPSSYGGTFHMSRDVAPISTVSTEPFSTTTTPRVCIEEPPPPPLPTSQSLPSGAVLCFCEERDNCGPLVPLPPGSYPQMSPHHHSPSQSNSTADPDTFYLSFPTSNSQRRHHSYPVSIHVTEFPKSPPPSPTHPHCCHDPEEEQEWVNVPGYYRPKRKQYMDVQERYTDWSPGWSNIPDNSPKNSPGNSPGNSSREMPESSEPSQGDTSAGGTEQGEKKQVKYACELKPSCRDKILKSKDVSRDKINAPKELDSRRSSAEGVRNTQEYLKLPLSTMSDRSNFESNIQTPKRFCPTLKESRSRVILSQYIDHHERIEYAYPETSPTNRARIMERVDYIQPETHMRSRPLERTTEFQRVEFSYGQPPCEVVCERVSHHEVVPQVATVVTVAPPSQAAMLVRVTPRNGVLEEEASEQRYAGRM